MPAGMVKAKAVDWKETNVAGLGSKENRELKLKAAQSEPAWEGAGSKEGLEVWRVEKFKIARWPKEQNGSFYVGDAYIILDTYKPDQKFEKLAYDVHFWLGSQSTQDEQGTAAYKTVELDDFLKDLPVQYRQCQGHESQEFLQLFSASGLKLMEGGIESGFNHVKPTEYKSKLFQCEGAKAGAIRVTEVPLSKDSLNDGDVFVLDNGLDVYQWNGSSSSVWEKRKAAEVVQGITTERLGKAKKHTLEADDSNEGFWTPLGGKGPVKAGDAGSAAKKSSLEQRLGGLTLKSGNEKKVAADDDALEALAPSSESESWDAACVKTLYKVSSTDDGLKFKVVKAGGEQVFTTDLDSKSVNLLDVKDQDAEHHVYVHVGSEVDREVWGKAIEYGVAFMKQFALAEIHPVTRIVQGKSGRDVGFAKAFDTADAPAASAGGSLDIDL